MCNAPVNSLIAQHARQQKYGGQLQVARDEEWPANTATLRGHTGSVYSVAVVRGPGGHGLIASGSEDKTIRWAGHNTVELGTEVLDSLPTSTSEGGGCGLLQFSGVMGFPWRALRRSAMQTSGVC